MIEVTPLSWSTMREVSLRRLALSELVSRSLRPVGSAGWSCQTIIPSLSAQ